MDLCDRSANSHTYPRWNFRAYQKSVPGPGPGPGQGPGPGPGTGPGPGPGAGPGPGPGDIF